MEINNFIKKIMNDDLESGKHNSIVTRFPPEPNAYLHIGHARAIVTNFELATFFKGKTNLRFDDTNPIKEDKEYVNAIIEDIKWLGYNPDAIFFGSDYFDKTYEKAVLLVKKHLAYVCDLSQEEMSKTRGNLNEPGTNSPYRNRSLEENLLLLEEMKKGKYKDGEKTLRAKIDMASPNMNMRDPAIYRIIHTSHHNTKDKWCIYPMYDFAHPLQDAFEGVTHSLCSLEYDNHRPLYDWFVDNCDFSNKPHQYEFGRLNINNTIMSKRHLRALVDLKLVKGYDDQRMPTLVGMKRRGFTPNAIKQFILETGLSRINSTVSYDMLEHFVREDLKTASKRTMAIMEPLKVIITNYPNDCIEYLEVYNNVENEELGKRKIAFGKNIYIEKEDFVYKKPNKKWKRLAKDIEVRLYGAYFITCNEVVMEGNDIKELHCTYDIKTKSGSGFNERKPNGTIHYVEATTAKKAKFLLFESLIDDEIKGELADKINQNSWMEKNGLIEESLQKAQIGEKFQFIRNGYFSVDYDSKEESMIFNRVVGLKSNYK